MQKNKERIEYLGEWCPCLYLFALKKNGMTEKLQEYIKKCESYEDDYDYDFSTYSLYIHGFWHPYLYQQIEQGILKQGNAGEIAQR